MASKDLLRAVREKSGLSSNYKLARKMEVSDQLVSRWERNLGIPDGMSMISLLEVSGLSAAEAKEELMKNVATKEAGFANIYLLGGLSALSLAAVTHSPSIALAAPLLGFGYVYYVKSDGDIILISLAELESKLNLRTAHNIPHLAAANDCHFDQVITHRLY